MKTQQCAPLKHHYDECAERVTKQQEENGKAEEDCVEECKFHTTNPHPYSQWSQRCTNEELSRANIQSPSLPPDALRQPMRRPEAVPPAAIDDQRCISQAPPRMTRRPSEWHGRRQRNMPVSAWRACGEPDITPLKTSACIAASRYSVLFAKHIPCYYNGRCINDTVPTRISFEGLHPRPSHRLVRVLWASTHAR